eukprot:EG_transcript_12510
MPPLRVPHRVPQVRRRPPATGSQPAQRFAHQTSPGLPALVGRGGAPNERLPPLKLVFPPLRCCVSVGGPHVSPKIEDGVQRITGNGVHSNVALAPLLPTTSADALLTAPYLLGEYPLRPPA